MMSGGSGSSIRRLPQGVAHTLRSSVDVPDLTSAAAALVLNSLEAGARSISVTANLAAWALTVDDDGGGVPTASLPLLGERCCSSKPGRRGETLAALALVCERVCLTTRAAGSFETYRKQLASSGTTSSTGSSTGSSSTTLCSVPRQRQGTTVSLVGILHNRPVRRRSLQQQSTGGSSVAAKCDLGGAAAGGGGMSAALQELRQALLVLMLPHVTVGLVMRQHGSTAPVLHMPKDRGLHASLRDFFSQHAPDAALCAVSTQPSCTQDWQLDGCVLTAPCVSTSRPPQLLFVNAVPVSCAAVSQLLRDWFARHVMAAAAAAGTTVASAAGGRHPEPGYVLLITCPATCCLLERGAHGGTQQAADFGAALSTLVQLLAAAISPAWGSLPARFSTMSSLPAAGARGRGAGAPMPATRACPAGAGSHAAAVAAPPLHGTWHMASNTRSLAGIQAARPPAEGPVDAAEPAWDGLQLTASQLEALQDDTTADACLQPRTARDACAADAATAGGAAAAAWQPQQPWLWDSSCSPPAHGWMQDMAAAGSDDDLNMPAPVVRDGPHAGSDDSPPPQQHDTWGERHLTHVCLPELEALLAAECSPHADPAVVAARWQACAMAGSDHKGWGLGPDGRWGAAHEASLDQPMAALEAGAGDRPCTPLFEPRGGGTCGDAAAELLRGLLDSPLASPQGGTSSDSDSVMMGSCGSIDDAGCQALMAQHDAPPTSSEDTVQQQWQQRRRPGNDALQQQDRAPAAASCAATPLASPPASPSDRAAARMLPPFDERLVMSAPPAPRAPPARRFAASACVSGTPRHAAAAARRDAAVWLAGSAGSKPAAAGGRTAAVLGGDGSRRRRHTTPGAAAVRAGPPQAAPQDHAAADVVHGTTQPPPAHDGRPRKAPASSGKAYVQLRLPFQPLDANSSQPVHVMPCREPALLPPATTSASKAGRKDTVLRPVWLADTSGSPQPPPLPPPASAGGGAPAADARPSGAQPAAGQPGEHHQLSSRQGRKRVRFSEVPHVLGGSDRHHSTQPAAAQAPAAAAAGACEGAATAAPPPPTSSRFFAPVAPDAAHAAQRSAGHRRVVAMLGAPQPAGAFSDAGTTATNPSTTTILSLDELAGGGGHVRAGKQQHGGAAGLQLVPQAVSRQQLQDGRVLAQADRKLLVTRCGSVLLLIDQHAAGERVQLEALQAQLAAEQEAGGAAPGASTGTLLQVRRLAQPQPLSLSMQEAAALAAHRQQVERWGWRVSLKAAAAAGSSLGRPLAAPGGAVIGAAAPALMHQLPVLAGVQLGALDLQLHLHQLFETCGSSTAPPPGVLRVLRSKACRSAVMFGDGLPLAECEALAARLAATQLCFMCAHGRPTTIPLVHLRQLADRLAQRRSLLAACTGDAQQQQMASLQARLRRWLAAPTR